MARTSRVQKRNKCEEGEEEEDYISDLPDCLIQHIISLLPSTEEAIRTGILSKRWLYQWTHIPNLVFINTGTSIENFSNFVDSVLNAYNCSKINKFLVNSNDSKFGELRPKLVRWIRFAKKRDVKELILDSNHYPLPQFFFNNALVSKLKIQQCLFKPKKGKVNWTSLKALHLGEVYLTGQAIESVLSGCPVIEYLELRSCGWCEWLDIASKSLKTLSLFNSKCSDIEISCPNLEKLELMGEMRFKCLKLKDLPPSVCVTLDFEVEDWYFRDDEDLFRRDDGKLIVFVKEILLQLQHVQKLKLGPWFLMVLSLAAVEHESSLLLNCKSLTVIDPFLAATEPGIAFLLISCSLLEKLVIQLNEGKSLQFEGSMELDGGRFDCLFSHLETVEIVGLHYTSSNDGHNGVLKFFEFLLKNARMLQKMVFLEAPGQGIISAHEVCNKLSCIQRASPHATVKVSCLSMADLHPDSDWDKIVC